MSLKLNYKLKTDLKTKAESRTSVFGLNFAAILAISLDSYLKK